jgi:hypothetical protein
MWKTLGDELVNRKASEDFRLGAHYGLRDDTRCLTGTKADDADRFVLRGDK